MVESLALEPTCTYIVAGLIFRVFCRCDQSMREELAIRISTVLMDIIDQFSDDPNLPRLAAAILFSSVTNVVQRSEEWNPSPIDVPRLVHTALSVAHKSGIMGIVAPFLANCALDCHKLYLANPKAIDILVALVRSPHFPTRMQNCRGLQGMYFPDEEPEDLGPFDSNRMLKMFQNPLSPELQREMDIFGGLHKSQAFAVTVSVAKCCSAMDKVFRDRDFYAHGKALVPLTLEVEYFLCHGGWDASDISQTGFPCRTFRDTLFHASKVIRERSTPGNGEEWMADVLEVKYLLANSRYKEAATQSLRCIESYPNVAFFYYVACKEESDVDKAIRLAKKGLRCPNLTPYVRLNLLYNAANSAFFRADLKLKDEGGGATLEAYDYAMSALEDAREYIRLSPPDARNLRRTIYIYILALFVLRGNELTLNSPEVVVSHFPDSSSSIYFHV